MATQRKDGRFSTSKMKEGNRIWGYGKTAAEATADLERKLSGPTTPSIDETGTLHGYAKAAWYPGLAHLKPHTSRRYTDAYRHQIRDALGPHPLTSITPSQIQAWINGLRLTLAPNTVRLAVAVLSQIMALAEGDGLIPRNPCSRVRRPAKPPKRERTMELDAALDLLRAAEGTKWSAPIFLAAVLGLRRGELCGIKWSDLDRRKGELRIARQRRNLKTAGQKGVTEEGLKTTSSKRTLRLTPQLIDELDRRGNLDAEYICTRDSKPWDPERLTGDFVRERAALGVPDGWTFHDLRHLAGGLLSAAGVGLVEIATILGHTKPDMAWAYASANQKLQKDALEKLSQMVFPVDTPLR